MDVIERVRRFENRIDKTFDKIFEALSKSEELRKKFETQFMILDNTDMDIDDEAGFIMDSIFNMMHMVG